MPDKYNYTVCCFCPAAEACAILRTAPTRDPEVMATLPRKCLLAESLLERHSRGVTSIPECPRCGQKKIKVNISYEWQLKLAQSNSLRKYTLRCDVCDLDEVQEV